MTDFAFQSAFVHALDADDKPIGTSCALLLSLLVALSETEADERGWFALSPKRGEELTGFSHDTQKRLRERLMAAGYIRYRFKGQGGQIQYLLCTHNAYKEDTQSEGVVSTQYAYKGEAVSTQYAYKPGNVCKENAVCTQDAYKGGSPPPSFPPPLSFPDPISPYPPIIPPLLVVDPEIPPLPPASLSGGGPPPETETASKRTRNPKPAFSAPSLAEIEQYLLHDIKPELRGSIADAEAFLEYWANRNWRLDNGRGAEMKDWHLSANTWMRHKEQYDAPRGSPSQEQQANRRRMGLKERAAELDLWYSPEVNNATG